MAAFSMATALLAREITGKGQFVDISLFRTIMGPQSTYISDFEGKIRIPGADRADKQQGGMPLYKLYQGSDGKWFFLALGNPTFFTKFALAMGHDEWLIDPLFEGAPFLILPPRNFQLIAMFEKIFATKTRNEWIDFLLAPKISPAPRPLPLRNFYPIPRSSPIKWWWISRIRKWAPPVRWGFR